MHYYIVIEIDSGVAVAEVPVGGNPEDTAAAEGGVLVDPGPYKTFEEAQEAMMGVPDDEEERAPLRE